MKPISFNTYVTFLDVLSKIREAKSLDMDGQDPCHPRESNLAIAVCPHIVYLPEFLTQRSIEYLWNNRAIFSSYYNKILFIISSSEIKKCSESLTSYPCKS